MLTAKPEFIDLFVADRPARPLARPAPAARLAAAGGGPAARPGVAPVLPGRPAHLLSAGESRAVLGVPDAYELPPVPGLGYLKPDQSTLLRFKAAYVSGPPSGRARVRRDEGGTCSGILPFTHLRGAAASTPPEHEPEAPRRPRARRASRSRCSTSPSSGWTATGPPRAPGLAAAAGRARHPRRADARPGRATPSSAWSRREWRELGGLVVPLGTVDRPREQRRDTLTVNLAGAAGHVAVVGGPRSGKSTLLRTIVDEHGADAPPRRSRSSTCSTSAAARSRRWPGCRTSPASPPAPSPTSYAASSPRCSGIVDRREAYFRAHGHRLDRDLPAAPGRRAAPTTGTATCSSSSTAGARCARTSTTSRCELQQLAARGLTFGLHLVVAAAAVGGLPRPRCATSSAPGSSCGSATRSTPRSTARSRRWCPRAGPAAA